MTYLRALSTLPAVEVEFGNFLTTPARSPVLQCNANGKPQMVNGRPVVKRRQNGSVVMEWIQKTEEKGSDVNLASYLLRDAFLSDCQCAVVVSNDSDLIAPIRIARHECGIPVGLITPRAGGSAQLRQEASFQKVLRPYMLAASQFPPTLADTHGTITKPGAW